MGDAEIARFLDENRTAVLATASPSGYPHLVAMWYVPVGPDIAVWTYRRSQKVANLRLDGRATLLVESGDAYTQLRGVSIDANVEIVDDEAAVAVLGARLHRRYAGGPPYPDGAPIAPEILRQSGKRVGLILHPVRYRSWDHTKLAAPR